MLPDPFEAWFVLALLAGAFLAFATERVRPDVVAMGAMAVLLITGVLSTRDALAVFSNEAPITVACMFVLSAALDRTGVIERVGRWVTPFAARSPLLGLGIVTVGAATVSAFINNTPVVVILTPVVIALAQAMRMPASKFLIPLSYATVLGGTCTLIGTSTNIVTSGAAQQHGLEPFHIFEIAPLGIAVTVIGIIYLMLFGFRLLPAREVFPELGRSQSRREFLSEVVVPFGSPLIGRTIMETQLGKQLADRVVDLLRRRQSLGGMLDQVRLEAGDRLVLRAAAADVMALRAASSSALGVGPDRPAIEPIGGQDMRLMEGIVGPRSRFAGRRVADLNLRAAYGVYILAVHRQGETLHGNFEQLRLAFGDTLLLEGPPEGLQRLFETGAFLALSEPSELPRRYGKAWIALLALLLVIVLAALDLMPISGLALLAAVVVVAAGCLDADEAYGALNGQILMLIFGSLALGRAMESSGAAQIIVDGVMGLAADLGPMIVLAIFYLVALILTEFLSNNATAILLTPIAIGLAHGLGVDPRPFVVAVMFAASNAFATPIGYQTNTFVYGAGGYKFLDFVKIGLPLNLITWLTAVILIPLVWPLTPR